MLPHPSSTFELSPLEPRTLMAGDIVLQWNHVMVDALRADRTLPGPGWSSRSMAIVAIAVYDAVNAFDDTYQPYLSHLHAPRGVSMDAAIAAAAHRALLKLYPDQKALFDSALQSSLATVPNGPGETAGVLIGRASADAILRERAHDGSSRIVNYTPNPAAGHWQPDPTQSTVQTAWGPGWGKVQPFAIRSGKQFRAPAPPALSSAEYAAAFNEVKSLGAKNSTTRTAEQTQIGVFWGYDRTGMGTPPALYCQAVETVALQQHNTVEENARLLLLADIAMADAGIAAWDTKFKYDLWRPVTAIRRAGEDGNPATIADPTWEPLGAPGGGVVDDFTPPFPAYVSGHATFGAAVFRVLADYYGTDTMHFTLNSDELPGVSRSFDTFSQAAAENARSRIYLGIHWNFDDTQGRAMGVKVGDWAFDHVAEATHGHGHDLASAPASRTSEEAGSFAINSGVLKLTDLVSTEMLSMI